MTETRFNDTIHLMTEQNLANRQQTSERIKTTGLSAVLIDALRAATEVHNQLGEAGEELIEKNQFGETALRADIACEAAVIETLRQQDIPIRVISEEHGQVVIGDRPRFLGVLDGLDGTGVYKAERGKGRYGTMFGIFEGTDPTYDDYLVSGIMEHSTGRLFMAVKGQGAFVIENDVSTPIHTSGKTELDSQFVFWADTAYGITNKTFTEKARPFKPFWRPYTAGSLAVHHVDVASGEADLAFECTRKGVLEEAVSYGLITESGGAICDVSGESLGDKKYLQFGQETQIPLIIAATPELAQAVAKHLKTGFETARASFFANFIRQHQPEYQLLKEFGLGPKPKVMDPNTKMYEAKDWRNVSKHCIVQAEAMDILADALDFSEAEKSNLVTAAFIHDFYKVAEREKDKNKGVQGQTNQAIEEAEHESVRGLRHRGYNENVIRIVESIGHLNLDHIRSPECTLPEKIMFLVDASTNDEVIIGAREKTAIMRGRNPKIAETGVYDKLDEATDMVEAELARLIGLKDPRKLADWLNDRITDRIMAWGAQNLAGNSNRQQ